MKNITDYEAHDSDNLDAGWDAVREYAEDALLAAWDGCHKIYLAMDEVEAESFRASDYADHIVEYGEGIVEAVEEWWEASCSLRFVSAVWTNESDPNAGYVSLISQFADEDDADDDDFDDDWHEDEDEDEDEDDQDRDAYGDAYGGRDDL